MANGTVSVTVHVQVLRRTTEPVTGAGATRLQGILNTLLLGPLAVDGQFGPNTEAAVKKFQQTQGLGVDGIVGAGTWAALLGAWLT